LAFEHLRVRPLQRASSAWANSVVDALNQLYGQWEKVYKRGTAEDPWEMFYGVYGYFEQDLFVGGKRVIKDGDPVNLYDIFEPAKERIRQAIDESKVPSESTLQALYGVVSKEALQKEIRSVLEKIYGCASSTEEKIEVIRDRIARAYMDEYGRWGVIIAEPLDEYGRLLVSQKDLELELLHAGGEIDTSTATSPVEIITPPSGRVIDVRRAYVSTNSTKGRVYIKFRNSGKIVTVIYASKYGFVEIPAVRIPGDPGDPVVVEWHDLDAGAYVFYSINYRIV